MKSCIKVRPYRPGKALSEELRSNIIDRIIESDGIQATGYFPGRYVEMANELRLSSMVVSEYWKQFCETGSLKPRKHDGGNPSNFWYGDLYSQFVQSATPATFGMSIYTVNLLCSLTGVTYMNIQLSFNEAVFNASFPHNQHLFAPIETSSCNAHNKRVNNFR